MPALKIHLSIAFLFMISLAACTSENSLEGTHWVMTTLNGKPALEESPVTLQIQKDQLTGSDGCNSYIANYSVKPNGALSVDPNVISTMMACAEPVMEQASAYTTALAQAVQFAADEEQLTLFNQAGDASVIFTAQNMDLTGTTWLVTSYNNGKQAVVSPLVGSEITAAFNSDGKLTGSAGCNQYTAAFEIKDPSIQIGPPGTTRKMCAEPAGVMEQEAQYLNALQTAATYHLDGDNLSLRTAEDALAVVLVKSR